MDAAGLLGKISAFLSLSRNGTNTCDRTNSPIFQYYEMVVSEVKISSVDSFGFPSSFVAHGQVVPRLCIACF